MIGWMVFIQAAPAAQPEQQQRSRRRSSRRSTARSRRSSRAQAAPQDAGRKVVSREEALKESPRVAIDTPRLKGSINLKGSRVDDLMLKDYRETIEPTSPNIVLLSPLNTEHAYYADFGWISADTGIALPASDTVWQADGDDAVARQAASRSPGTTAKA